MEHHFGRVASKSFSPSVWNAFLSTDGQHWVPFSTDHSSMYGAMEAVNKYHDLRAPGWMKRHVSGVGRNAYEVAITMCRCEG